MKPDQWMQHFVEVTEKRFDSLENKLDAIIRFKWQIIGGSAAISIMITIGFQIITRG
jgi:hypothetical protein